MSRPAPCPRRCPRSKERPRRLPRPCGACSSSIPLLTQTSVTGCPSRQSSHLAFPGETSDFAPPPHDGFALFDSFRDLLSSAWGLRLSRVAHFWTPLWTPAASLTAHAADQGERPHRGARGD